MIINKIKQYIKFMQTCIVMVAHEKTSMILFLVLSILAALTEGVGISLLVPILESQASQPLFKNVPILKEFSVLFADMEQSTKLQNVALVLAGILLTRGVLLYFVELLAGIIPLRIQSSLYSRGYKALLNVEHSYFAERSIGDHINSLTDWTLRVTQLLSSFAIAVYAMILVVIYLVLMLTLSWKMALMAALFVGVVTGILKKFTRGPLHAAGEALSQKNAKLSEITHETMTGMKFIKMSAAESVMERRYNQRLQNKIGTQIRVATFQAVSNPFLVTSSGLFICALLFGSSYVNNGTEEWLSSLLMFLFLLMRLLSPISQINAARVQIFAHSFSLEMLNNFFQETALRKQSSGDVRLDDIKQSVEFNNVEFKYPQSDETAIRGISMKIEAGQMVAVVGPSGAGKSTLVSLLLRFFDPQSGNIKIDGVDLCDIDIRELRSHISVVSQDIFIFNDTVSKNLSFAIEGVSDEDIHRAAKLAAADEFIAALPEGYETKLGDRGVRLSGGQQQRIAIARAILRKPGLLVMDEATSHLDTFTERAIQDAVEVMRKDHAILVIAHRLSTIRRADNVIVLNAGQIVEQGSHDHLMSVKGAYWDMVQHQSLDLVDYETVTADA